MQTWGEDICWQRVGRDIKFKSKLKPWGHSGRNPTHGVEITRSPGVRGAVQLIEGKFDHIN